jgi:hypothetical protein
MEVNLSLWLLLSQERTPFNRRIGGPQSQSGHFGGEKSQAAIGIQIPVSPAHSLVAIPTKF